MHLLMTCLLASLVLGSEKAQRRFKTQDTCPFRDYEHFTSFSPLASALMWESSRSLAPNQGSESAPALVPRNNESWVGGGEGGGDEEERGEEDKVWQGDRQDA